MVSSLVWALFPITLNQLVTVTCSFRVDLPWGLCWGVGGTGDVHDPGRARTSKEDPSPWPPILVGGCCSGGVLEGPWGPQELRNGGVY